MFMYIHTHTHTYIYICIYTHKLENNKSYGKKKDIFMCKYMLVSS